MSLSAPIKGYRLIQHKFADTAFTGYGAFKFGGRWNSPGSTCVYVADTESLAMLEVLVHTDQSSILEKYAMFEIELDPSRVLLAQNLPKGWDVNPAPLATAQYGDQWIESKSSLALKIPSTIVPRQYNYLISVYHPDFAECVKTARELPFSFDHRLK